MTEWAVVEAYCPFNNKHADEYQWTDCAADQQESERQWISSNSFCCCFHRLPPLLRMFQNGFCSPRVITPRDFAKTNRQPVPAVNGDYCQCQVDQLFF